MRFRLALCVLCLSLSFPMWAVDWTLAASPFTFTQSGVRSSTEDGLATLLPQLVLEHVASGATRITTLEELTDRSLDALRTDRLSLFLQLSKEVQTRDSLVLSESNPKKLKRAISDAEKNIAAIQKKIDQNLSEVQKLKDRLVLDVQAVPEKRVFFQDLKRFFSKKEEGLSPTIEQIVLYQQDSSTLFVPDKTALAASPLGRDYERAVLAEKINCVLTGSITIYGAYMAVSAQLHIYPGGTLAGGVTEVGALDNPMQIAENIAHALIPAVANSKKIDLFFDITPEIVWERAQVVVDGVVYGHHIKRAQVPAGIHTVEITCEGYNTQSITWNFSDIPAFLIHVPLKERTDSTLTVNLKKPFVGSLYANGAYVGSLGAGSVGADVTVNGKPVIGRFISEQMGTRIVRKKVTDENGNTKYEEEEEDSGYLGSFFYIPESVQKQDASLVIKAAPVDNAKIIDRRRVWMYRGYTALICSLPFSFYSLGVYSNEVNRYNNGYTSSLDRVNTWNTIKWVAVGISGAAGVFFAVELVRYLRAADGVLPKNARAARKGEVEKSLKASQSLAVPDVESSESGHSISGEADGSSLSDMINAGTDSAGLDDGAYGWQEQAVDGAEYAGGT